LSSKYRKLLIEQDEPNKKLGVNLVLFVLHMKLVVQKLLCTSFIFTRTPNLLN